MNYSNKYVQESLKNVKQKYIYQRYNGIITKYIDNGDYYINCETGIATYKDEHLMLGKISENIIDLIEIGDIVKIRTGIYSNFMEFIDNEECLLILKEQVKKFWTIEEILIKEIYMANCYKVGGEDE